jgi:uncharacterized membrane protein
MAPVVKAASSHPFRGAVARGLGILLPPLLTIVIFLWIGGTVDQYVLAPVVKGAESLLVWWKADIRSEDSIPLEQRNRAEPEVAGEVYHRLAAGELVPKTVYDTVVQRLGEDAIPRTGNAVYRNYFRIVYLRPYLVIPAFLLVFTLLLYLLGKFIAAGIGRFFWGLIEAGIVRVPLVRNVYSAVKQVSSFLLNERQTRVSRVVAVEYPRPGVWALGFVMGGAIGEIEKVAGDECVTVLICTSPMPMAGFTITIRRSEVIDLHITLDQAIQFIVSCGVVIPPPKTVHPVGAPPEPRPVDAAPIPTCVSGEAS